MVKNDLTTLTMTEKTLTKDHLTALRLTEKLATHKSTQERFNFCPIALKKGQIDPQFFVTVFAYASFSTFASRAFLFVGKFTNKSCTSFRKTAKELNPSRIKNTCQKKNSKKSLR